MRPNVCRFVVFLKDRSERVPERIPRPISAQDVRVVNGVQRRVRFLTRRAIRAQPFSVPLFRAWHRVRTEEKRFVLFFKMLVVVSL